MVKGSAKQRCAPSAADLLSSSCLTLEQILCQFLGGMAQSSAGAAEVPSLSRKLRNVALAACRLGHRSCHALWGPSSSPTVQTMDDAAASLRKSENIFVIRFDANVLRSDDDALVVAARELSSFLSSSSSAKLRNRSPAFRDLSFEFAVQMRLSNFMSPLAADDLSGACGNAGDDHDGSMPRKKSRREGVALIPHRMVKPGQRALTAFHDALLAMHRAGVGVVVCICNVTRFGIWCDRMMYLLSGLMHDAEDGGAGMALLLTSSTADLRNTEKRLSSRLTCEMWFVPPRHIDVVEALKFVVQGGLQIVTSQLHQLQNRSRELDAQLAHLTHPLTLSSRRRRAGGGGQRPKATIEADANIAAAAPGVVHLERELRALQGECGDLRQAHTLLTSWSRLLDRDATDAQNAIAALLGREALAAVSSWNFQWEDVYNAVGVCISRMCRGSQGPSGSSSENATSPPSASVMFAALGGKELDLLENANLVRLGYVSRECLFLLTFALLRCEAGLTRTVSELTHDIASSLGSATAIKNVVVAHYTAAFSQLCGLGLTAADHLERVSLMVPGAKLSKFLREVLSQSDLCDSAGLTVTDRHLLAPLVR